MNIIGQRVDDIEATKAAGAYEFFSASSKRYDGLLFRCPCGCEEIVPIHFRPLASPSWLFNGDIDAPSLSPEVIVFVGGRLHVTAQLKAGIWSLKPSCRR